MDDIYDEKLAAIDEKYHKNDRVRQEEHTGLNQDRNTGFPNRGEGRPLRHPNPNPE
jgi:hypothetical protein